MDDRWPLQAADGGGSDVQSDGEDAAASLRAVTRSGASAPPAGDAGAAAPQHRRRRSRSRSPRRQRRRRSRSPGGATPRAPRRSRSRSRSRSRRHVLDTPLDDVDWSNADLRVALDAAFHSRDDVYPVGAPEHRELLDFVPRLATLRVRQRAQGGDADAALSRLNVTVHAAHERALGHAPLPPHIRAEYLILLSAFEDFNQKRSFAKLVALAKAKAALPIAPFGDEVAAAVRAHSVLVLAADTGAGKSTQVPQFLLRAGFGRIAVTQPRRLAATALAARVAHETLHAHGARVGYKVRFDAAASAASAVVFLTEGVLLRELASDAELSRYDVVVVDEAHERHVATDLLLGLLKLLVRRRPTLRVVVMSATIDVDKFASFFDGAPVIQVPGRLHPIRVEWVPPLDAHGAPLRRPSNAAAAALAAKTGGRPVGAPGGPRLDPAPFLHLLQRIDAAVPRQQRGDALVFLPGAAEIDAVAAALAPYAASSRRWVILPLHAGLPAEAQARVFEAPPPGVRKAILATNVAETSVTVDGVRFVIDSGRCKLMRHDAAAGGGALREGWVSAAAAAQRAGRAGRTGPGVCYRLYSPEEFAAMEAHTPPEIQRAPLEGVVLQLKALCGGDADPSRFPWLDAPDGEALRRAVCGLRAAGALTRRGALTLLGAALAALPCDAAPGKLLLLSALFDALAPGAALAAALGIASPLSRPNGSAAGGGGATETAARALRAPCVHPSGDPLTVLSLFAAWAAARAGGAGGPFRDRFAAPRAFDGRRWCRARGLEEPRLVELAKLQRQLASAAAAAQLQRRGDASDSDNEDTAGDGDVAGAAAAQRRVDPARRAARRELRALQRRRDRAHGAGVLRAREDGFAAEDDDDAGGSEEEGGEAADGRRGAGADAARLRELELALGADLHAAAAAGGAGGDGRGAALLQALLLLALYPNVALADGRNAGRRAADARFITRSAADVALHPSSVLAAEPAPDEPGAAEAVWRPGGSAAEAAPGAGAASLYCYGELLDTHRPFLLHVTRLPAAALLLAAREVDTDAAGCRALCDGWALLRFGDAAEGASALAAAAALRRDIAALLAAALRRARRAGAFAAVAAEEEGDEHGASDADTDADPAQPLPALPAWAAAIRGACRGAGAPPAAADVASRLSTFLARPFAAAAAAISNPAALSAQRTPTRGTLAAPPWLRVGGLRAEASAVAALAATPHMRAHWACPVCGASLIAAAADIEAHAAACAPPADDVAAAHFLPEVEDGSGDADVAAAAEEEGAPPGAPGARCYDCAACGRALWLTPTAWLRHRAAHAASDMA